MICKGGRLEVGSADVRVVAKSFGLGKEHSIGVSGRLVIKSVLTICLGKTHLTQAPAEAGGTRCQTMSIPQTPN